MTSSDVHESARPSAPAGTTRVRALAVAGAVLAALAVWVVAVPVLDVDLRAETAGEVQEVGPAVVVVASLVASLLGWALLAVLERFSRRGTAIWTGVAVVVLLLSLASPLTGGVTTAAKVSLALMHLAVGAVLIPSMRRRG